MKKAAGESSLTVSDRVNWSAATADVRPLKGKKRLPAPKLTDEELRKKPIRAKTPVLRVAASKLYDAKLDLHGLTESGAHKLLVDFMRGVLAGNDRKLLIITGKGVKEGTLAGILRAQVPRWLDVEPIASRIRSIEEAPPALGGSGAYLVTLKTKRK